MGSNCFSEKLEIFKTKCASYVEEVLVSPSTTNTVFLELCAALGTFMTDLSSAKERSDILKPNVSASMISTFNQMISSLDFLAKIIKAEEENDLPLNECRKVAANRILFCLESIDKAFSETNVGISDFGQFLRWMDSALDQITKIDLDLGRPAFLSMLKTARSLYEDILAHAMSIAQVCLEEDRTIIGGSCRTVLDVLNDLQNELNKSEPNKAMVSLFVEDAGNKLCTLERRVDIAVLKLSLFVFSRYCGLIEKLHNFCEINNLKHLDEKEFDDIVADFDLHVDRIFQIGFFALYCSSNVRSGTNIRNYMASLEFLEAELVPAMKMILKDHSEIHATSACIYKDYWISEANKLKNLVYEIIDPVAFCKVIYNEIVERIKGIIERCNLNKEFSKDVFIDIFNFGKVLIEFLLTVVRIEAITEDEVKDCIRKCNIVTSEIGAGIDALDDNNFVTNERLLKRCKILQSQIKKLLFQLNNNQDVINEEAGETEENKRLTAKGEEDNVIENESFSRIICKGRELLENRSIMYRTPKQTNPIYQEYGDFISVESCLKGISIPRINFSFRSLDQHSSLEQINFKQIFQDLSKLTLSVN